MTADAEFLLSKAKYKAITGREQRRDADVLCYQIRQSFKPGEITPEEANRVGYETAMRWTKGKHAFFVATHTDRRHIHNHIYYNSTALDCAHKYRDFFRYTRPACRFVQAQKQRKKRRARFLRSLRFLTVFDSPDQIFHKPQFLFIHRIEQYIDTLFTSIVCAHFWIKELIYRQVEHGHQLIENI